MYVCNYGVTGNILRRPVYKQGTACSACPCGTSCSQAYPGVCATNSTQTCCHDLLCMLNMPMHIMHNHLEQLDGPMTMGDLGDVMMKTIHMTGDMAMNTAHGAIDTAQVSFHANCTLHSNYCRVR